MDAEAQNQNSNPSNKLQSIFLAAAFVLFVLSAVWGIFSGVASGKDQATYANVDALNSALHYYFSDQDQYPTATQFKDQLILVPLYLSSMPQPLSTGGSCAGINDFAYSQSKPSDFKLQFCLQQGTNGLSAGIHALSEKGVQ